MRADDGSDAMFRPENIPAFAAAYLGGGADAHDPDVSPRFADFDGMPPLLIQVGSEELLLDDARMVASRSRAAGATVVLQEFPGCFHCWQMLDGLLPEAGEALRLAAAFLRLHAAPD